MLSAAHPMDHNSIPPSLPPKRRPGRPPVYVFTKPDAELSENERRLKGAVLKRRMRQNRSYHRKKRLRQMQAHDEAAATAAAATVSAVNYRSPAPLLSSPNPPRLSNIPLANSSSPTHHHHTHTHSPYQQHPHEQNDHQHHQHHHPHQEQHHHQQHSQNQHQHSPHHPQTHHHQHHHQQQEQHNHHQHQQQQHHQPQHQHHHQQQQQQQGHFSIPPLALPALQPPNHTPLLRPSTHPGHPLPQPQQRPALSSFSLSPSVPRLGGSTTATTSNPGAVSSAPPAIAPPVGVNVNGNQAIAAVLAHSSAPTRIQDPLSPTSFVSPTASTTSPKPGDETRALQQLLDLSGPTSNQVNRTAAHSLLNQSHLPIHQSHPHQQNNSLHMNQTQSPHNSQPQLNTVQPQIQTHSSPTHPVNSQPLSHSPHHPHHNAQQDQHNPQATHPQHQNQHHHPNEDQTSLHHPMHRPIQPIQSPHHQNHHSPHHHQQQPHQNQHHQHDQHQHQHPHQHQHQSQQHPLSSQPPPSASIDVQNGAIQMSPRISGLSHSITEQVPGLLLFPASFTADAAAAVCQAASTTVGVGGFIEALLHSGVIRHDNTIGRFIMDSNARTMFTTNTSGVKWRRRFVDFFTHKLRKCANGRLLSGNASDRASALRFYHVEERNIRTAVGFARNRDVGPNRFVRLMSAVSPCMRVFVPARDRIDVFTSALQEMEKARSSGAGLGLGRRTPRANRHGETNPNSLSRAMHGNGKEELTTTTTTTATTASTSASTTRLGANESDATVGMNTSLGDVDANGSGTIVGHTDVEDNDVDEEEEDLDLDEDDGTDSDGGDANQSLAEADGRVRLAVAEAYFDSLRVRQGSVHLNGAINSLTASGDVGAARSMSSMIALILLAEVRLRDGLAEEACGLLAQAMHALREAGLHKSTLFASCLLSLASAYAWNGADAEWEKAEQTVRNALDMLKDLGLDGCATNNDAIYGTSTSSTTSTHGSNGRGGRKDMKGLNRNEDGSREGHKCAVYADGLRTLAGIRLRVGDVKQAGSLLFGALDILDVNGNTGGVGVEAGVEAGVGVGFDGVEGLRILVLELLAETYAVQNQTDDARKVMERARYLRGEGGMDERDVERADSVRVGITRHVY